MSAINGVVSVGGVAGNEPFRHSEETGAEKKKFAPAGDTTTISDEARQQQVHTVQEGIKAGYLQEAGSETQIAEISGQSASHDGMLSGVNDSGTRITVVRNDVPSTDKAGTEGEAVARASYSASFTRADGSALNVSFSENLYVQEGMDGTTSVFDSHANKTRVYDAQGGMTELDGNAIAADADTVVINTVAGGLRTGNGNNTVFNLADGATIQTGSGNDTIYLADGVSRNVIDTHDGNDRIVGGSLHDSSINLGEGDNALSLSQSTGNRIEAGNGKNAIDVTGAATGSTPGTHVLGGTTIRLGNGDNSITASAVKDGSTIIAGDGNNTIKAGSIRDGAVIELGNGGNSLTAYGVGDTERQTTIKMGDGDNALDIYGLGDNAKVETGDGNGSAKIYEMKGNARLATGNGNNTVSVYSLNDTASIDSGNGDNAYSMYSMEDSASFTGGNGANRISLYQVSGNASFQVGDGNNAMRMYEVEGNASVSYGDGHNAVRFYSASDNSSITMGNGHNALTGYGVYGSSSLSLGGGNNDLSLWEMAERSSLTVGNGNNMFAIGNILGNVHIRFGTGDNLGLAGNLSESAHVSGLNLAVMGELTDSGKASAWADYQSRQEARHSQGLATSGTSLSEGQFHVGGVVSWQGATDWGSWNTSFTSPSDGYGDISSLGIHKYV